MRPSSSGPVSQTRICSPKRLLTVPRTHPDRCTLGNHVRNASIKIPKTSEVKWGISVILDRGEGGVGVQYLKVRMGNLQVIEKEQNPRGR